MLNFKVRLGPTGALLAGLLLSVGPGAAQGRRSMSQSEIIRQVLAATEPLQFPRGDRLPLYVWVLTGVGTDDDAEAEAILRELDARGLAVIAPWHPARREQTLAEGLRLARLQQRLGLPITINATACLYSFFNGDPATFHLADDGTPFFDDSFSPRRKMGCPFTLQPRIPIIREQVEFFLRAYQAEGLSIDFIFADWEIDGPLEWNEAWAASKRCRRCRENIPNLEDFRAFQQALRALRSDLQREVFAEPVKARFPQAMVGNYAVYPHGGYRYWYDYFEQEPPPEVPCLIDRRARYRPWAHEFARTGYTCAMPVVYTWYRLFNWYDFDQPDYRWFYNLLLVGSNAGQHTPAKVPLISFVHWHTTSPPKEPDPSVKQFSAEKYQELLWHLLLRGHDTFFLWCPREETAEEVRLVHQVYAAALEFREFLDRGEPVTFAVPPQPGPVVSGLRLGDRVLVRRTDFEDTRGPVTLTVEGRRLGVSRVEGRCQVLRLEG